MELHQLTKPLQVKPSGESGEKEELKVQPTITP